MPQKAYQLMFNITEQSYKRNKNTLVLVYYSWLSFIIPLDKDHQNMEGTMFAHCKYSFGLEIWTVLYTGSVER